MRAYPIHLYIGLTYISKWWTKMTPPTHPHPCFSKQVASQSFAPEIIPYMPSIAQGNHPWMDDHTKMFAHLILARSRG